MRATRSGQGGVILMVVLALLTLFEIVGITFVFYAQKEHTGSGHFREAADRWEERTKEVVPAVRDELLDALRGDVDLATSAADLAGVRSEGAVLLDMLTRERDAEQDCKERVRLDRLRERLARVVDSIDRLLIQIQLIETPDPNDNPR